MLAGFCLLHTNVRERTAPKRQNAFKCQVTVLPNRFQVFLTASQFEETLRINLLCSQDSTATPASYPIAFSSYTISQQLKEKEMLSVNLLKISSATEKPLIANISTINCISTVSFQSCFKFRGGKGLPGFISSFCIQNMDIIYGKSHTESERQQELQTAHKTVL